jgi:maltodextrin utilization protein YvdJ
MHGHMNVKLTNIFQVDMFSLSLSLSLCPLSLPTSIARPISMLIDVYWNAIIAQVSTQTCVPLMLEFY